MIGIFMDSQLSVMCPHHSSSFLITDGYIATYPHDMTIVFYDNITIQMIAGKY